jgi:hypothetical protein
MALTEAQFAKLHTVKVDELDSSSRFAFKVSCSCGVQGLFLTKEGAEAFKKFHIDGKRLNPY